MNSRGKANVVARDEQQGERMNKETVREEIYIELYKFVLGVNSNL